MIAVIDTGKGFNPSDECLRMCFANGMTSSDFELDKLMTKELRTNPTFINVVSHLGPKASTDLSKLSIFSLPDDIGNWKVITINGKEKILKV